MAIPWRTDFVLPVPQPAIIAVAVPLVFFIIIKDFFLVNKAAALGVTLVVYLIVAGFATFVTDSIAAPFFRIIESLGT